MPNDRLPPQTRRALDNACKKAGDRVRKVLPDGATKAKAARYFNKQLCKDVDQKALKALAQALAKLGKEHSSKAPAGTPKQIKAVPKLSKPGKGVPSLTVPLSSIPLEGVTGNQQSRGKLKVTIWADPRELRGKDKGAMLNFTVNY